MNPVNQNFRRNRINMMQQRQQTPSKTEETVQKIKPLVIMEQKQQPHPKTEETVQKIKPPVIMEQKQQTPPVIMEQKQQTPSKTEEETVQKLKPTATVQHTTIEKVPICSLSEFEKDVPKLEIPYTIYKGFNANNEYKIYVVMHMKIAKCYEKLEKLITEGINSITLNRMYQDYSKEGKTRASFYTIPTAVHKYELTNKDGSVSENIIVYGMTDMPDDNILIAMEKTTKDTDVAYKCRLFKYSNFDDKMDPSLDKFSVTKEEIDTDVIHFF